MSSSFAGLKDAALDAAEAWGYDRDEIEAAAAAVRIEPWPTYTLSQAMALATGTMSPEELTRSRRAECFQGACRGYIAKTLATLDADTDEHAAEVVMRYIGDFAKLRHTGTGIILCGELGVGKSSLAAAMCNALVDEGYRCRMVTLKEIVDEGGMNTSALLRRLSRYDLLVLDDFGSDRDSDYMRAAAFEAVNYLYGNETPVAVTTNMTVEQVVRPPQAWQKTIDRLKDRGSRIVEVRGRNRRAA